jgi:hypothetical protein
MEPADLTHPVFPKSCGHRNVAPKLSFDGPHIALEALTEWLAMRLERELREVFWVIAT